MMPLQGLHVDSRPKANVQRRQYAEGEVQSESNGGIGSPQPRAPSGQPSQSPTSGTSGSNSGSNRIDPSQIPRPDAGRKAEKWCTRANVGQLPPPATSAFIVEDDGNCSPRYMRLTLNQVMNTAEQLSGTGIPFAVVAQPLAEVPAVEGAVPVVDLGESGPVR